MWRPRFPDQCEVVRYIVNLNSIFRTACAAHIIRTFDFRSLEYCQSLRRPRSSRGCHIKG
jgi:hypothetical protein